MNWELYTTGPEDATHTVLLLPGGACAARSFTEVMNEPALAHVRCVAATLPGNCGTEPPEDVSIENYARLCTALAEEIGADVVVGFSMGATVALEMAASKLFTNPVVLTGISMSAADEAAFFRFFVKLSSVVGAWPYALMMKGVGSMVKGAKIPQERKDELRADFARNKPAVMRRLVADYIAYLHQYEDAAQRLCDAHVPTWVMHAEKGDGRLSAKERATLEACDHARVITIPGTSFLLPNDHSARYADVILEALAVL